MKVWRLLLWAMVAALLLALAVCLALRGQMGSAFIVACLALAAIVPLQTDSFPWT